MTTRTAQGLTEDFGIYIDLASMVHQKYHGNRQNLLSRTNDLAATVREIQNVLKKRTNHRIAL